MSFWNDFAARFPNALVTPAQAYELLEAQCEAAPMTYAGRMQFVLMLLDPPSAEDDDASP